MGRDKALLELDGTTLLERVVRAAIAASLPAVVVGRPVPPGWPIPTVEFLPDRKPGEGPLGGLVTALAAIEGPLLVLGCDLPLLTPAAVAWLASQEELPDAPHGTITEAGGDLQPLFARYLPAVQGLAEELFAAGRRSMHALLAEGRFERMEVPDIHRGAVRGVNTPTEMSEAVASLEGDPPVPAKPDGEHP